MLAGAAAAAGATSGGSLLRAVGCTSSISGAALLYRPLGGTSADATAIAVGMIIGGALGNVLDRVRFGAVTDFLDFHVAGYHWPAFNVADSGIVIGAGMLIFESLFLDHGKS